MLAKRLVLIGAGGHMKSVLDSALRSNEYKEIVITDPRLIPGTEILGCRVVGTDDILKQMKRAGFEYAFVSVGSIKDTSLRRRLADNIEQIGFKIPIIIDPSAIIAESAVIGEGSFVGKGVIVNTDAKIGRYCIINSGSIIEHECCIGDFSHVAVGSTLCGDVFIDNDCLIGSGSVVIQGLRIGKNCIIGANSTVLTDVEDRMKVYGIIKKRREHKPKI